jgi:hypothetical protein
MIYMNRSLIAIVTVFFLSCNNKIDKKGHYQFPENSKNVQLQLIDSLGVITLSVPIRYDTNFSWIHYSDCGKPCDEQKYRYQPSILRITKESGWIWLGEPKDSVESFTISHKRHFPFNDGDTSRNIVRHNHIKTQLVLS